MLRLWLRPKRPRRTQRAVWAIAIATVISTGCASIINGRTQRVAVGSDPPGARVFVGDRALGVTPIRVELDRGDGDLVLRFEKDCYRDAVLPVPRRTSNWVAGNVLLAGVPVNEYTLGSWLGAMAFFAAVGGFIDWRSGGAFTLPDLVQATLDPMTDVPRGTDAGDSEPPDDCAPDPPAGPGDQGNTPSDR